ncbi:MAG: C40 family peptidase [Ilumatobacteraceae bacterium]
MAGPKGHQNMTPRVSYYPKFARVTCRALVLALFFSFGLVPSVLTLGLTKVDTVEAKPMPAIESAWVAMQAQRAVVALESASEISPIEQRDVASRWIKSISVVIAEHLEVDSKNLERAWLQSDLSRQKVLFAALSQLGVPYKTNADEPGKALDCSALIKFAWSNAGIKMPRGSAQQYAFGERVKASEVQLGDLAWYPGHISMSLGFENLVIQSPTNGRSVEVHEINESRVNWVRWVSPAA